MMKPALFFCIAVLTSQFAYATIDCKTFAGVYRTAAEARDKKATKAAVIGEIKKQPYAAELNQAFIGIVSTVYDHPELSPEWFGREMLKLCLREMVVAGQNNAPAKATSGGNAMVPGGRWSTSSETSRIDDSRNVFTSLDASEPVSGWPNKASTPILIVRCQEKKTDAYIVTGMSSAVEYGTSGATITLRLDKQPAFKVEAHRSVDGESLFFPNAVPLLKKMLTAETLLFSFVPYNSTSQITSFDLRGMSSAIKAVRDSCKW